MDKLYEDFEKWFDFQIKTEENKGAPKAITEMFQSQRIYILSKAEEMFVNKGNIPFLLVIPRTCISLYFRMPMVRNGNNVGYAFIDPVKLTNIVSVPVKPYCVYNVEDGTDMLGESPRDAEKLIRKDKRLCLVIDEVISLGIHSNVLSRQNVLATGSRYFEYELCLVPGLWLLGGKPAIGYISTGNTGGNWGAASCGSREIFEF